MKNNEKIISNFKPKKILIIGSGPIIIGQAAEFDYSGTQACLSLKEDGYETILINPNPATIMTDKNIVNKVYMEPLNTDFAKWVISREKPDAILPTLGGQIGLNLTYQLHQKGILNKYNVKVIGTSINAIIAAEDRKIFKEKMLEISEPIINSQIVTNIEQAQIFAQEVGFPLAIRPSYTMGGSGGGFANNFDELEIILKNGLNTSPIHQCLVEKSLYGFKEIEFEVMRDSNDTTIVVCGMENIDPVGIHTGDSMVVCPCLTLNNNQYQMLRYAAIKIIKHLKIEGGCNVQMALNPQNNDYYIIEINPRVSRSSALASKATGYPIAKISVKIALGQKLEEIFYSKNNMSAAVEPAIDYVVTKLPRFPFDKFKNDKNKIYTYMQATGESMAIGRNFEESFLKCIRGIENEYRSIIVPKFWAYSKQQLLEMISEANGYRIYQIFAAFHQGITVEEISKITFINIWFIKKFFNIYNKFIELKANPDNPEYLQIAKKLGFSDFTCGLAWNQNEFEIYDFRKKHNIFPVYKIIDTCASEFPATTPYFYSTYNGIQNESKASKNSKKVLIIGSGSIRIGQGVEFDYSTVHSVWSFQKRGYETIVLNNNPETVSTDFSISDKLYFEPLRFEDFINIYHLEKPSGVVIQFGGQTALNLAKKINESGEKVKFFGTQFNSIDISEDRNLFADLMSKLNILTPESYSTNDLEEAKKIIHKMGFPIMIRPSYVIGGSMMQILSNDEDLKYLETLKEEFSENKNFSILIDKYIEGIEIEIDAVCDGKDIFIPGIMEHIESAGIHSGDSTSVYPNISLSKNEQNIMIKYLSKINKSLKVCGIMNSQLIVKNGKVYILEINLRSSRTIPFISKSTGINVIDLAVGAMVKEKLNNIKNITIPINKNIPDRYYIKSPVFSFNKLNNIADSILGPEMKSTGEAIGIDSSFDKALYKSLLSSGIDPLCHHSVIISCAKTKRDIILKAAQNLDNVGYKIYATPGTQKFLLANDIRCKLVNKLSKNDNIIDLMKNTHISYIINVPSLKMSSRNDLKEIRKFAISNNIAIISSAELALTISKLCANMKYLIKPL